VKPCGACGADFTPKRRDMRFCCKDCRSRAHSESARNARRAKPVSVNPCDVCGKDFALKRSDMRFCSEPCWNVARNDRRKAGRNAKCCAQCGVEFRATRQDQSYCSSRCRHRAKAARAPKPGRPSHRARTVVATCQSCGSDFSCTRRDAKFCSKCGRCTESNLANARRRAARIRAVTIAPVVKSDIYARDDWTCQLCGEPVRQDLYPHPLSASLDHIVPLSKGGTHEPANVQLAHLRCNIRKGNRLALVA
jgi:hypothetical protein